MKPLAIFSLLLLTGLLTSCPPSPYRTGVPTTTTTTTATIPPSGGGRTVPIGARPGDASPDTPAAGEASALNGFKMGRKPKNIILMIGDGMGVTQISAGLYMNNNRLHLEAFPFVGLHKSYSGDNLVTDSAAGATAFSAGVKTYNGAIGVGMDTLPVTTILEMAEAAGLPTGLVASSSIVHATPASFIAHNRYRKNYEEIAADFTRTDVDLLIGGGIKFFDRRSGDKRNLSTELRSKGYVVENFIDRAIKDVRPDVKAPYSYLTADAGPLPFSQGRDYLVAASRIAPDFLDRRDADDKGFFLMIEGSQIDWGGHANDSDYIISEMLEFNQAIGEVLDFARRDGETLIIVTADHETGGYAIQNGSSLGKIDGAFTSDYHTADLIPVFAYGPGAEHFSGIYENTAIFDKMKALFGF